MKNLLLALLLVVGFTAFAQEKKQADIKSPILEKLSQEQRNELHLKKLTLELGLNQAQQKEIGRIIQEQAAKREAAMAERKANKEKDIKLSTDQRYAVANKKLDEEIAVKEKVKQILTPEQFKKWEELKKERKEKMREQREKRESKT